MRKINLLQKACYDFEQAELALEHYSGNKFELDIVAYHVQQTIEKLMTWELECAGVRFSFTYIVPVLYHEMLDNNLNPPDWILNHYSILKQFATKTRYGEDLVATLSLLKIIINNTREYLNQQIHIADSQKLQPSSVFSKKLIKEIKSMNDLIRQLKEDFAAFNGGS